MKTSFLGIVTGLVLLLGSCSGKDRSVSVVNRNGHDLLVMNLNNTRDSTRIILSDIATGLRFIRLETLPECLISYATYYITDDYVLAKTKSGIYQFDGNGRFIRLLVAYGEGPMEFTSADWVVDEIKGRLILSDEQKTGYFLCFDLKSGQYLGDIPKAIPGVTRRFLLTDYGSLACVPYTSPGTPGGSYYLYWQDLEGKLVDAIKGPADLVIFRGNYLARIPEGYRYMLAMNNKDTVYTLKDKKLIPYLAFNHGEKVPDNMEEVGYRNMKIILETDQYLMLDKTQLSKVETSGSSSATSWNSSEYLFDKISRKGFLISGIYNDFIEASQPAQFFKTLPNGIIYNALQSMELIGIADRAVENPKSDQKLIHRMEQVREQVGRDDNPVLIVGNLK
jgi:hypothetical protein